MTTKERLFYNKIETDIAVYGWSSVGVMPTVDDPDPCMPFTYTIGFYEHDQHPELIVVGLHPHQAHAMLAGLYERIARGERFEDGQLDGDVLEGYDVRFQALPPEGRPLNAARSYYGLHYLPALQVLWPDANGVFPDEDGFEERFVGRQEIKEEDL